MALTDDLTTAAADLATIESDISTLKGVLDSAVADLTATAPVPTPADTVVTSVVTALEAAGYTVTPPAVVSADSAPLEPEA